jgi:hypothetical protein
MGMGWPQRGRGCGHGAAGGRGSLARGARLPYVERSKEHKETGAWTPRRGHPKRIPRPRASII